MSLGLVFGAAGAAVVITLAIIVLVVTLVMPKWRREKDEKSERVDDPFAHDSTFFKLNSPDQNPGANGPPPPNHQEPPAPPRG